MYLWVALRLRLSVRRDDPYAMRGAALAPPHLGSKKRAKPGGAFPTGKARGLRIWVAEKSGVTPLACSLGDCKRLSKKIKSFFVNYA